MDPPDLFSGLYDEEKTPRMPQERQSAPPRPSRTPSVGVPPRGLLDVKVKDSSILLPNDPVMSSALRTARRRGDVITSGYEGFSGDGVHSVTSQHYSGTAIDIRYATGRAAQIASYARLGYVVVPEKTHLHVQAYPVTA
jgi:hypothetical protein